MLRRRHSKPSHSGTPSNTGGRSSRRRGVGLIQGLARIVRDRRGAMMAYVAVAAPALFGFTGLAVDTSMTLLVESRLSRALDSAGLAAGRVVLADGFATDARDYFDANFPPHFLGATITSFTTTADARREFITVSAEASLPTVFMRLIGRDTITVSARTVVQRLNRGAEVALVMDNTGSMRGGGKMTAMKEAARNLIETMFGDAESLDNLWVSVVPYTAAVNMGAARPGWLRSSDRLFTNPASFAPARWKGCVEARRNGADATDDPPAVAPFTSFYYPPNPTDNDWPRATPPAVDARNSAQNEGYGPNLGCGPAITSLTNVKSEVLGAVDEMLPWHRGGTTSNLGLVWGWRTLSPRWQGLWGGGTPAHMPLYYDEPLMEKIAIVLTDGVNQFYDYEQDRAPAGSDYTAYGRLYDFMGSAAVSLADGQDVLDARFAATCEAMKDVGITIYTITFGGAPDSATRDLYRQCATDPTFYYHAPDADTLAGAFRSIGQKLSNLRLVE